MPIPGARRGDFGKSGEGHVAGLVDDLRQWPAEAGTGDVTLVCLILQVAEQAAEDRGEADGFGAVTALRAGAVSRPTGGRESIVEGRVRCCGTR
jgi:hypothetical protein